MFGFEKVIFEKGFCLFETVESNSNQFQKQGENNLLSGKEQKIFNDQEVMCRVLEIVKYQ